jgi:hypothetical protein
MANLIFGYETNYVEDISDVLQLMNESKASFVSIPLFHPRLRRDERGISGSRRSPGYFFHVTCLHHL